MAKAIKIRMNNYSQNRIQDIKDIYLIECMTPGWYSKEEIHNHLITNPGSISVNLYPYPKLIPATNGNEKYVKSTSNDYEHDNLLNLDRE